MASLDNKFKGMNTEARSADYFDALNVPMSKQFSSDNEMSHESNDNQDVINPKKKTFVPDLSFTPR